VEFYENDGRLRDIVVEFVAQALTGGEAIVVIATEVHRRAFSAGLIGKGFDFEQIRTSGRLVLLDADETLSQFMVDGLPDWNLFQSTIVPVLENAGAAAGPGKPTRAYGEMVDVLWRRGNRTAAEKLEEMWNDLQKTRSFSLLCAYVMSNFYEEGGLHGVHSACKTHTEVRPPLNQELAPGPAEHVQALVAEIAERSKVEQALRESLRDWKEAERARQANAQRTDRLKQITAAMADAVTPDQVFEAVVDQVGLALTASSSGLWLVKEDQRVASLCRANGYSDDTRRLLDAIPVDQEPSVPVIDAIRQGQAVWVPSRADLVARYPHLTTVATPGRQYSIACLPIVASGRTLGALAFTFDDARPLDEEERSFLLLVARYSAQALERLRLLESERASRARAELLYGLAAAVIGAENVEDIFQAALDAIEGALGTDRASILIFDTEGVMRFRAWRNLSDGYRRAVEGHSPWSRDAHDPQPIFSSDVAADPAMESYRPLFRAEGIGALGFIPLVAAGRLIGKFMVYYDRPRSLASQELDLARAIANHVAAAVCRFNSVAELQQTVRFNEMFTGILGHDLRNPLGAIITAARLAMARDENDRLRKPLSRILSSGDRMTKMIDQLLDFTRVRLGAGIPLHRQPVDLRHLIRQMMDELDDANPNWALRLEETGDTTGVWDPDRLSQAFSNLVANAVQHGIVDAGVTVTIDGAARQCIRIEVHNGGAIAAEVLPKVFEPLSGQVQRIARRGLGLGLFITKEIVRSHGGEIAVRSDHSTGTRFTVVLPRGTQEGSVQ
jgi:signal transduction histidine kinase